MKDYHQDIIQGIKSKIATRIESRRLELGWNKGQMAKACGMSNARYSNMINGNYSLFTIDYLLRAYCSAGLKLDTSLFL